MAQKLSVTIALQGGKEIEQQLADIGEAGKKAFADIGAAADKAGGFKEIKPEEVTAKLKELGITGVESINKIQAAVKSAGRLETLVQGISSVETAFATLAANAVPIAGAIAAAFVAATKAALAWADSVNKADAEAIKLGISIEKFDQLRQGMEKLGLSAKAVASGIETIAKNLEALDVARVKQAAEAAAGGAGLGSEAMKRLQAATEGTGKAADDARLAFTKLADAQRLSGLQADLAKAEQAAERARAALAQLASVPIGTPGRAEEFRRLSAGAENAAINVDRARAAVENFKPSPAPLTGAAAAFDRLGIAAGNVSERLPQVVAALARLPDSAQRSADAILLFGQTAGTELIQALRAGGNAVDAFVVKQAQMTQAQANEAARTEETLNQLSAEWVRFKATVIAPIAMPTLEFLRTALTEIQKGIATTIDEFNRLAAAAGLVGQTVASGWNNMIGGAQALATDIGSLISKIGGLASAIGGVIWDTFASAGQAAINAVSGAIDALIQKFRDAVAWASKLFAAGGGGTPGGAAPGMAGGGLVRGRGSPTSDSILARLSRGEYVTPASVVRQPGVLALLESLRRGVPGFAAGGVVGGGGDLLSSVRQMIDAIAQAVGRLTFQMVDGMRGVMANIDSVMRTFSGSAQQLIDGLGQASDALFGAGFAHGGLLGGRGTGTSDSNLAWVSRGEHIMPAAVVRQPGVLAFLEALRSGIDLRRLLDGMGRFAAGGPVAMPALAGGGVGSMSHVTIQFPGLPAVGGLRASSDVVEQLQRAAAMAQVRSGGRKPSRYG